MNYTKLLEDYLNETLYNGYTDNKVIEFLEAGYEIQCYVKYDDVKSTNLSIPLFDLITFVYSKISV